MSLLGRRLAVLVAVAVGAVVGCGGRTPLYGGAEESGGADAGPVVERDGGLVDAGAMRDAGGPTGDAGGEDVVVSGDDGGRCCGDEQNGDYPPSTNCSGIAIAWQYVPSCDFSVVRIELHKSGGTVALLDHDGMQPGATLWTSALPDSPSGDAEWEGADVEPPVALEAGHVYFLEESSGVCSIATDGTEYPYYGLSSDGSWDGPYMWHPWTSHVLGACH